MIHGDRANTEPCGVDLSPHPLVVSGRELPPDFPAAAHIEWAALEGITLLRHGTGTSLYTAVLDGMPVVVKTPAVGLNPDVILDVVRRSQGPVGKEGRGEGARGRVKRSRAECGGGTASVRRHPGAAAVH